MLNPNDICSRLDSLAADLRSITSLPCQNDLDQWEMRAQDLLDDLRQLEAPSIDRSKGAGPRQVYSLFEAAAARANGPAIAGCQYLMARRFAEAAERLSTASLVFREAGISR